MKNDFKQMQTVNAMADQCCQGSSKLPIVPDFKDEKQKIRRSGSCRRPVCRPKFIRTIGMWVLLLLLVPTLSFGAVRVGIVYSEASANQFYDKFAYSQLFMAMQHQAMMAGIPFDVLTENDLISSTNITDYSALIVLPMPYTSNETGVVTALTAASQAGVGIITGGLLISTQVTESILGVSYTGWVGDVPAVITAANVSHPIMQRYQAAEQIIQYSTVWLNYYEPVDAANSTILANATVNGEVHGAAFATIRGGRNVYFLNDQIMGDTNLVWQALRWVVYGDSTPIALKMGRSSSIFVSRNDMDASMYYDVLSTTDVPLLNLLRTWKQNYNFVGSFYINIGNDQAAGEYTNWSVSAPLLNNYLALGNEIGTHSYTHPDYTADPAHSDPADPEYNTAVNPDVNFEFEFNQSMLEIEVNLGIEVTGAAIPGNPENLAVDWLLNPYFEYISGRWSAVGAGYPGAFGYLTPDYSMLYFSLNLSPDYTLVEWLGNTPAQATQIWTDQYNAILSHASQPIIHWLWHDYGPTEGASAGIYTTAMFANTIAMAYNGGSEFATADDIQKRIAAFQAASLDVSGSDAITVDLTGADIGAFCLELDSDRVIANVDNWYAYDEDQVFIPQNGGRFVIHQGTAQDQVTHIASLPMRARLLSVTGDGSALTFNFEGEGAVVVQLNPAVVDVFQLQGGDSSTLSGTTLQLNFSELGTHSATVAVPGPVNRAPVANDQSLRTSQATPIGITLTAGDLDGDALTFALVSNPAHGTLSGTAPDLTYTPDADFSGIDSFTFMVNDSIVDSAPATVTITVTEDVDTSVDTDNGTDDDGDVNQLIDDVNKKSSGSSGCFISTLF